MRLYILLGLITAEYCEKDRLSHQNVELDVCRQFTYKFKMFSFIQEIYDNLKLPKNINSSCQWPVYRPPFDDGHGNIFKVPSAESAVAKLNSNVDNRCLNYRLSGLDLSSSDYLRDKISDFRGPNHVENRWCFQWNYLDQYKIFSNDWSKLHVV